MKKLILLFLLVVLSFSNMALACADSTKYEIEQITPYFEKFDSVYYERIKKTKIEEGTDTLKDGTYTILSQNGLRKYYSRISKGSYFNISKTRGAFKLFEFLSY